MPPTATPDWPDLADAGLRLLSRSDAGRPLRDDARPLWLDTPWPDGALVAERLVMRESVGQPFELVLDALSASRHLELKTLLGEQVTVRRLLPDGRRAPWSGYVTEAAQLGADGGLARYRLVLRPWLSLLDGRRDCFIFQDQDARQIIEAVFRDHPQAQHEWQVQQPLRPRALCTQYRESDLAFVQRLMTEEGLSCHWVHLDGPEAEAATARGQARHRLVITDRFAARPRLGPVRFTGMRPSTDATGLAGGLTRFSVHRRVGAQAVARASWNHRSPAGLGLQAVSALDLGALPLLEDYDARVADRHPDRDHLEQATSLALAALELAHEQYRGEGQAPTLQAGAEFELAGHPRFGPSEDGWPEAASDPAFVVLSVEHHASNLIGPMPGGAWTGAEWLGGPDPNRAPLPGGHWCIVHCAPASAAVVPRPRSRPTAPGSQTALVVGVAGQAITTDRDLRVRIQFPWQRGERPLRGGLAHPGPDDPAGNAPGDERSGTWVRVAQGSAGPNWGSVFVPRIDTEVLVQFLEGDIDRPVIVGALHNGQDLPPFSAGEGSGTNHPGTLSGLHSRGLDGQGHNQWLVDDTPGQLRTRLLSSAGDTELALGHLIDQRPDSPWRGAWRGSGFEARTQAWASVRAGAGLLLSTQGRPAPEGAVGGTQMDASEALASLRATQRLVQQASQSAKTAGAQQPHAVAPGQAIDRMAQALDPEADGRHAGPVGGQDPVQSGPDGRLPGSAAVHALGRPLVVLDSAASLVLATDASIAAHAGQDSLLSAHQDLHHAAGGVWSAVAGQTASLHAHAGGLQAVAASGPLSVQAHSDTLQLWADQSIQVVSTDQELRLSAQTRIELIGGACSLVLDGGDITFTCPGTFSVRGASHAFLGGARAEAALEPLPEFHPPGQEPCEAQYVLYQSDARSVDGHGYELRSASGEVLAQGQTAPDGKTQRLQTPQPTLIYAYQSVMPDSERITEDWRSALDAAAAKLETSP